MVVVACSGILSACGGTEDDGTINLMLYAPQNETAKTNYKKMIEKFTVETGIKVKVNFVPKDNYNQKLTTVFQTENRPDVFFLDQPMLADYSSKCMNLNEGFFAAEDEEGLHLSDFYDVAVDTVMYKGDVLAVPFSLTSCVLLYNKSLVTDIPSSWSEWLNMDVESGKALFGGISSGGYASWYFQAFLKSAGGNLVEGNQVVFNNEKGVAAATMVANLYAKSPDDVRSSNSAFVNNKIMFVLAHNSDIINYYNSAPEWCEKNLGATLFIPQNEGGTSYSNIGGENIAIYKDTKYADACKQLVRFLLREENVNTAIANNFSAIKKYAKVRATDAITGEAYPQVVLDAFQVVLDQLSTASARPVVKKWTTKVNDIYLAQALASILDSGTDVKTALDTAQQQAMQVVEFD